MDYNALAVVVTGLVQITALIVGFLMIWVKLKYGIEKAEGAAIHATEGVDDVKHSLHVSNNIIAGKVDVVKDRLEASHGLTEQIVQQTNGMIAELAAARLEIVSLKAAAKAKDDQA